MRLIRRLSISLCCVVLLAGPVLTPAEAAGRYARVAEQRGDQTGISLDEAARRVAEATGGRVLAANRVEADGRTLYRIKVLTPRGVVRVLWVDPASGAILGGR